MHPFYHAIIIWVIGESLRPQAAKASLPLLGRVPTIISGPPAGQGLLDSLFAGGGLGGLFGGMGGGQQPPAA